MRPRGGRHPVGPSPPYPPHVDPADHAGSGRDPAGGPARRVDGRSSACSGLGVAGILWGAKVQSGLERPAAAAHAQRPDRALLLPADGGSLPDLLRHGRPPAAERRRVPAHGRRRGRPTGHTRPRRPPPAPSADVAHQGLPVRHRLAGARRAVGGRAARGTCSTTWASGPRATHVRFHSFDGVYTETLTMEQARRDDVLVAHQMLEASPSPRSTAARCASTWRRCTATSRSSGSSGSRWPTQLDQPTDPGYWERLGYDTDAWVGDSNGRDDEPT